MKPASIPQCPFVSNAPVSADLYELQTIIETSLEPFVSIDATGIIVEWNAQAGETFGWTRAEAIGRFAADLIVPSDLRERHREGIAKFRFGVQSAVLGQRVRLPSMHRDGTPLVVELCVAATTAPDGAPRFHAFIRDITLLERARSEILQRERLLAESQQIAHLGSYWHDLVTGVVLCSDELFAIIGLDKHQFDGTIEGLLKFIHPDDREDVVAKYQTALKGRSAYDLEHRIIRSDGGLRVVRRRGYVTSNEAGRAVRVSATLQDITEARQANAARHELEARFARSFEEAPFGMALIGAQRHNFGHFVRVNEALLRTLGYELGQLDSAPYLSIVDPADEGDALVAAANLIDGGTSRDSELRFRRSDGATVWIRQHLSLVRDELGEPLHFFAHIEDITTRRADRAALAELHERLRRSIEDAPIGMALIFVDPAVHTPGRFREVNAALCDLTGYDRDVLHGMSLEQIVDTRDFPAIETSLAELLASDTEKIAVAARYVHADGSQRWLSLHLSLVRAERSGPCYAILQIVDITAAKRSEKRMAYLADHDALTRLLNRRGLERRLRQHLSGRPPGESTSVLMIDLDYFKYVNDSLGHAAGDRLLRVVAATLKSMTSPRDFVARLGGDEFVVVLRGVDGAEALERARYLRENITREVETRTQRSMHVTASVGITTVEPGAHSTVVDALAAADMALSIAKEDGRDRAIVAESLANTRQTMRGRMEWAGRIRAALRDGSFCLYRQPIMNLATKGIDRYELLLRMLGSDGSIIPPASFLGEAERFGLMVDIDTWVVTEGIRIAAQDQRAGNTALYEINLSAASLSDESVVLRIKSELERMRAAPERLIFELAETTAIGNMDKASRLAESLSALGCAVALDDFGAGFSSFYYLKRLPFDYLKIDGEFITNIMENEDDRHIVQAIVQLAKGLKKKTIAEFVGSAEAIALLSSYGVDFAQGYYIGKPEPIEPSSHEDALPLRAAAGA